MSGLLDQRLWIVSGKGGVGKSTLSAALALASARRGRRTLVCEVNAQERVAPLLGHPPSGAQLRLLEPNLWSVDVRPEEALREYGLMILRFESLYRAVFENRVVRQFLRFIPSLQELVLLGKVLFHVQEREAGGRWRYDTVVLDAPATGHAVSLLRLPQVLLDTVPPGPLAAEAEKMRDVLLDSGTTAALCATLPEEMPLSETFELVRTLRTRVQLPPAALILNQFVAPRFDAEALSLLERTPAALALARRHQALALASADALTALAPLQLPIHRVPLLYAAALERREAEQVAESLDSLVEGRP